MNVPSNCPKADRCQDLLERRGFLPVGCVNLGDLGGCQIGRSEEGSRDAEAIHAYISARDNDGFCPVCRQSSHNTFADFKACVTKFRHHFDAKGNIVFHVGKGEQVYLEDYKTGRKFLVVLDMDLDNKLGGVVKGHVVAEQL